jgi:hypothetical protein
LCWAAKRRNSATLEKLAGRPDYIVLGEERNRLITHNIVNSQDRYDQTHLLRGGTNRSEPA